MLSAKFEPSDLNHPNHWSIDKLVDYCATTHFVTDLQLRWGLNTSERDYGEGPLPSLRWMHASNTVPTLTT